MHIFISPLRFGKLGTIFSQIVFLLISFFPCRSPIMWTLVHLMVFYTSLSFWLFSSFFFFLCQRQDNFNVLLFKFTDPFFHLINLLLNSFGKVFILVIVLFSSTMCSVSFYNINILINVLILFIYCLLDFLLFVVHDFF